MSNSDATPENSESGGQAAAFPVNDVEHALQDALAQSGTESPDPAPVSAFISALREGQVWVPLPQGSGTQDDGSVALPTLELEGSPFIPAFTSEEQLGLRSAELPYTVLATRDLAEAMPEGVGLALNPGNPASVPIYPDTIAVLAQ
ncbi:SseB family protein [Streptomonospora sp. PA3]|uniref:SseB family protein n=1 Tax=Streptomonospora sp. PA3 TaxID=2607326 RepID=UPI0012DF1A69|nr:SseB family protein [Streptomonospora sp. PA3]MUL43609.1 SseB family protein [Streptomonospora sp. PA3]